MEHRYLFSFYYFHHFLPNPLFFIVLMAPRFVLILLSFYTNVRKVMQIAAKTDIDFSTLSYYFDSVSQAVWGALLDRSWAVWGCLARHIVPKILLNNKSNSFSLFLPFLRLFTTLWAPGAQKCCYLQHFGTPGPQSVSIYNTLGPSLNNLNNLNNFNCLS